ncbi:MAG: N-6 DNA methylase, partial [Candidatus Gastranaerophilales bacterium]|nr:N-6 DNA methylase [Candidatus Gastranaerophilales bacterium]
MQKMLIVFDYLKRYHSDIFDAIAILLEIITLKRYSSNHILDLLNKAEKRKPIKQDFDCIMADLFGDLYTAPNSNINLIKILKAINEVEITDEKIEILINTITQKKTINKLYSYSTPMEINRLIIGILDIKDNDEIYNPCYGIGSLFLALSQTKKKFSIYGEELDSSLDKIAKLILKSLDMK